MAGNIVVSQINGGSIGVINAIINGNFAVNQRAVSGTVTLAAGAYGHDRWKAGASGCTYTFATANNITTLTISAGSLIQVIEGNNLFTGTYTLSWVGTAQGKIGGGSYASSGVTGTPAGGSNLNIEFNTGTLSLVQFEPGSVATPFERRLYGTELQLAQRYFVNSNRVAAISNINTQHVSSTSRVNPVPMRAAPTLSVSGTYTFNPFYGSGTYNSSNTPTLQSSVSDNFIINFNMGSSTGTMGFGDISNATISLSAEL